MALPTNTKEIVDRMGVLRSRINIMENEYASLCERLKSKGPGAYDGNNYRATVSQYEQERLDVEAARAKLGARWVRAHTLSNLITRVAVVALLRRAS